MAPPPLLSTAASTSPEAPPESLLAFTALGFERDDVPLFDGLSGAVAAGDILQIAGGNGSGKTTLLRILSTALSATEGSLHWRGKALVRQRAEYLADLVFVGHSPGIKLALTPRENLSWLSRLYPVREQDIAEALVRVGLAGREDVPCRTLSAGQQRRVALARLLIARATLWVLDEPMTAIDQDGVALIEELLRAHAEGGGAVILSSHQALNIDGVRVLDLAEYACHD